MFVCSRVQFHHESPCRRVERDARSTPVPPDQLQRSPGGGLLAKAFITQLVFFPHGICQYFRRIVLEF
jgi:hypothetical protein